MSKSTIFLFTLLLLAAPSLQAEVVLPTVLGSNMVLQREKPLPIWGTAAPGEAVTVTFGNQTKRTTADAAGKWEVILAPLATAKTPARMTIAGTNTILLENILVGEVWLCSGQSNMEFTMGKSSKFADATRSQGLTEEEIMKINNPQIRTFLVKRTLYESGSNRGWEEAEYPALKDFSAAGYFFAEKLQQELDIPIGIISSAVSGSPIERWAPVEVLAGKPDFDLDQDLDPKVIKEMKNGRFYYEMIEPLAPFALRGFLWYQGETNAFLNERFDYTDKMQAMINTWRHIWRDQQLPFYYVQIAPFLYSKSDGGSLPHTEENLPEFWEAQAAALQIPHTGMVVTTDLVDNLNDIHPTYKWEIGRRLARWPLALDYGQPVAPSGPMFAQMKVKRKKVILEFTHTGSGLVSRDGKPLDWFTIAGADGKFVPAKAVIKGNKVIVSSPVVAAPVAVRFGWNESAQPNLYNKEGLPGLPFRTDGPQWQPGKPRTAAGKL